MIKITKNTEPFVLEEYRLINDINTSYENFRNKDELKTSLLIEQGFICSYCMCQIGINKQNYYKEVRIEHYRSKSTHKHLELEYSNLHAVCTLSEGKNFKNQHCDVSKGNSLLSFDPQNQDHIDTISYDLNGYIKTVTCFENDILNVLGLNRSYLPNKRHEVLYSTIEQMKKRVDEGFDLQTVLERTLNMYSSINSNGRKFPFCGIVTWYCKDKLTSINKFNHYK